VVPEGPGSSGHLSLPAGGTGTTNTHTPHEYNYARIQNPYRRRRKYADVEIPFFKEQGKHPQNIQGRTIRPDGSIVKLRGKAFDKTIVKAKGRKVPGEGPSLCPNVAKWAASSSINYTSDLKRRLRLQLPLEFLSEELFTKRGKFSLKPKSRFAFSAGAGRPALCRRGNGAAEG